MSKLQITSEVGFSLLAIALLVGCGAGNSESGSSGVTLLSDGTGYKSISISPSVTSAAACSSVQFTAIGTLNTGATSDVTNILQWGIGTVSSGVALVTASGIATGFVPGTAEIHAWSGQTLYASAVLNVTSAGTFAINGPASAVVGSSAVFAATSTCGTTTVDVSHLATWSSGSSPAATIMPPSAITNVLPGTFSASAVGNATISATISSVSATVNLNVQ
jgi:hypothetical protein